MPDARVRRPTSAVERAISPRLARRRLLRVGVGLLGASALAASGLAPSSATAAAGTFETGFVGWRAADGAFAGWRRAGVRLDEDGALRLDRQAASPAADEARPEADRGGSDGGRLVGEATSPEVATGQFVEAIGSWNAETPPGTWIEPLLRARVGGEWTGWYSLGVWASDRSTVHRHSVAGQTDADGTLAVDTLKLRRPAEAVQLRFRLFSVAGEASPTLQLAAIAHSTAPRRPAAVSAGAPELWGRELTLPACSQMVYPDGGRVWCSPTSTAMVLGYWLDDAGACEPRVRAAVDGVYDATFRGHGNWPFNTAYAATQGLAGYVARFASLAEAEPWIAAGVPVVVSFAFGPGELANAPLTSVSGHIAVLAGFDRRGSPIVYDPAAPADRSVRRVYDRRQLEAVWQGASGGTVYLIHPPDRVVPRLA